MSKIDWNSFMTNDDDPDLNRLVQRLQDELEKEERNGNPLMDALRGGIELEYADGTKETIRCEDDNESRNNRNTEGHDSSTEANVLGRSTKSADRGGSSR